MQSELEKELTALLNKCSAENDSDTPDFILAEYLMACLKAFEITVFKRDKWYGFKPWGGDGDSDAVKHCEKCGELQADGQVFHTCITSGE